MLRLRIKYFLFLILCFFLSVQNARAVDIKIADETFKLIKNYYDAGKEANEAYKAANTEGVGDDVKAYLKAFAHAANLRAEVVEKNLKLAEKRFAEFEKLEAQIQRLAAKYELPKQYEQLIKVSGNKSVENVEKTLENNWKKTLVNLDAETTKIKKMTTGVNKYIKTVATVTGAVNDLWTVGNEVYETVTDTDREWSENFKSTVEILKTGLPYVSQAASGPLMAAEIGGWVYETSMNYYMDKMRALGEERISIMFEAEKSFRTDVKFIIDDEIIKSKGKTQIEVEANIRKRIAARSQELAKRFDYKGGDFYKIVFGNCEKYIFCAEAAMDKLTGGALTDNYRQLQDYVTGFILPDSPQLIQHLKDRKIPEKIKSVQGYYQASDELYKQREELQNQISKLAPIKVDLPALPSIGSGTTSESKVIKNDKKNIQDSVTLTKPTISPATIEAGKTVTISTTADKEIPSNKAVFLVVNNNEAQPIKMTPLSATKWSHNLVVSKAGNHQVKAYLSSLSGIISSENSASSTAEFKVTPTAKVTKVVPDKADVVDGGSMKFTATVSGAVDEANGDQVLLWLDSYKQPMQRVGNSQTWSTTVTNIAGVNGKRDYTARVQNDDAFSAEAPHGTLTVKLSDAILIAEAHEISAQSRRVDTVKLNDHVHFFVETGGTVNGAVRIKLNQWSTPPLIKLSENKWRTAESIPIQQAENKTYYAYVEVKGQEAVKSATKPLKVIANTGLVCPLSANTGDLLDAELLIDRSKVTVTSGKLYIDTCGEDSGEREIGFSESGGGWKWPGITIKEKYCGTFKVIVKASDNKTYNCTTYVNSKVSGVQVGKSLTELQPVKPPPYKDITCLGNQRGNVLPLTLSGDIMNFNCSYTDEYYADRGLEGSCCVSGIGCKTFKLKQKVQQAVQLMPGKNICDVYYDDGQVNHEEHDHLEIVVQDNRPEIVKKLYSSFADYYNSKDDSRLRSLISDDWESVGDGTTLADLEMNLRSSFRIFDQVSYTIQNLQIASMGSGKFKATYDVVIKGQIYKNRINHEEKSSVSEEVTVDTNGKAKISKTLNGRFWYVQ